MKRTADAVSVYAPKRVCVFKTAATTRWKGFKRKEIATPNYEGYVEVEIIIRVRNIEAENKEEAQNVEEKAENYAYELQWGRHPGLRVEVEAYETVAIAEVYEEEKARLNKVDAIVKPFDTVGVALL